MDVPWFLGCSIPSDLFFPSPSAAEGMGTATASVAKTVGFPSVLLHLDATSIIRRQRRFRQLRRLRVPLPLCIQILVAILIRCSALDIFICLLAKARQSRVEVADPRQR